MAACGGSGDRDGISASRCTRRRGRMLLPELDAIDQNPVDVSLLAEVMCPHVEQAAEVCAEEADRFLTEGFRTVAVLPPRPVTLGFIRV